MEIEAPFDGLLQSAMNQRVSLIQLASPCIAKDDFKTKTQTYLFKYDLIFTLNCRVQRFFENERIPSEKHYLGLVNSTKQQTCTSTQEVHLR